MQIRCQLYLYSIKSSVKAFQSTGPMRDPSAITREGEWMPKFQSTGPMRDPTPSFVL
ncbi:hypothetical protein GCWU000342_00154 [Shuttleworthella satelles DSM 14600]|uniref:Uncharacterized protein n=1 Tax=Shuttleworthella satelles DSM 14600 TaxID=626523 RepID=C4G7Y8_9FIRM|nr:hypothetical protein GCWU000342_00154 [Shuttleworthia satelles DSM 14600]